MSDPVCIFGYLRFKEKQEKYKLWKGVYGVLAVLRFTCSSHRQNRLAEAANRGLAVAPGAFTPDQ